MFSKIVDNLKKSNYNPYIDTSKNMVSDATFIKKYNTIFNNESIKNILLCSKDFVSKYRIIDTYRIKRDKGVFLIQDIILKKKYVCRIKRNSLETENERVICDTLGTASSDKIANYVEYKILAGYTYFIIEYIHGLTLHDYIKNKEIDEKELVFILNELLLGLQFIHSKNIIHCDIKLDNVMITDHNKIKIIDFDLSKVLISDSYLSDDIFGTSKYISPESYDLGIYSFKSDIWSLGILAYVLLTKKFPYNISFCVTNSHSNLYRRNEFKHPNIKLLKNKIYNNNYNIKLYNILVNMIEFNVDKRFGVDVLLTELGKI